MKTQDLKFADVREKVAEHLKTALGVEDFSITYAKLEEDEWKVNVEFEEKLGAEDLERTALFKIDASTGEAREFQKGYAWRF